MELGIEPKLISEKAVRLDEGRNGGKGGGSALCAWLPSQSSLSTEGTLSMEPSVWPSQVSEQVSIVLCPMGAQPGTAGGGEASRQDMQDFREGGGERG